MHDVKPTVSTVCRHCNDARLLEKRHTHPPFSLDPLSCCHKIFHILFCGSKFRPYLVRPSLPIPILSWPPLTTTRTALHGQDSLPDRGDQLSELYVAPDSTSSPSPRNLDPVRSQLRQQDGTGRQADNPDQIKSTTSKSQRVPPRTRRPRSRLE